MIRFTFACALAILVGSANGQELIVAFNPGSNETVTVDSGTYASAGVGYQGTGTLINNGAFIGGISLGYEGHGTYVQNGPSASVISLATSDYMELAFSGIGTVLQNGGTISYAGRIRMGQHLASSRAWYFLNGGTLNTGSTIVGENGHGTFIQTGGLHQTTLLQLGYTGGDGTYLLSGGTLLASGGESAIQGSCFTQTGGLNMTPVLFIGTEGIDVPGNYTLGGGTLSAGLLAVSRAQSFIQTGGFVSVSQGFVSAGGDATFGNATWAGGATFETHGGAQTLTVDTGSETAHNLSMTLFAFPGYPPHGGDPRVTFESSQHLASLKIFAGSVTLTPGGNKVLETDALEVGGKLDLNDNELRWDSPYNGPSPIGIVRNLIASARYAGGGVWKGFGITSSMADATTFGLGYWNRFEDVDVKRAYYGDANGDDRVDVSDLGAVASHWQSSGFWSDGDFNYDGTIDVSDLALLATNWQTGAGGSPLSAASFDETVRSLGLPALQIPEPALSLLRLGTMTWVAVLRRRERKLRH